MALTVLPRPSVLQCPPRPEEVVRGMAWAAVPGGPRLGVPRAPQGETLLSSSQRAGGRWLPLSLRSQLQGTWP